MALWCAVLLTTSQLWAQEVSVDVQQFGIAEGLNNRDVHVFKDSNGFLWVYSLNSLQRYDGYSFKSYELPGRESFDIDFLTEDPLGWLCIAGLLAQERYSVFFLHPVTGEYKTAPEHLGEASAMLLESLFNERIDFKINKDYGEYGPESNMLKIGRHDRIYFKHDQQLIIYDFSDEVKRIALAFDASYHIETLTPEGDFWVAIDEGDKFLCKINQDGEIIARHPIFIARYRGTGGCISTLIGNELYYPVRDSSRGNDAYSIYALSEQGEHREVYKVPLGYMLGQMVGESVWLLGPLGWKVVHLPTGRTFELAKEDYGAELFEPFDFKIFFADSPNRFYISSGFGFNIVSVRDNPFTNYFNKQQVELPFYNAVRGIWADEQEVYFNCEFEGLVRSPLARPDLYEVLVDDVQMAVVDEEFTGKALLRSHDGSFLIGGRDRVLRVNPETIDLQFIDKQNKQPFHAAWSLFEDRDGCIWVGYKGLIEKKCDSEITSYPFGKSNYAIYQIQEKSENELWLSTNVGLYVFDKSTGQVVAHYHSGAEGAYYLPASDIRYLYEAENGDKWLASGRGLIYWPDDTDEKRLFTREDGLANTNLYTALPDNHNRLWLSSDYGIMSFDRTTFNVNTYLPEDGTGQEEFNRIAHFEATDGTIFLGGLNGVTAFHPDDFRDKKEEQARMLLSTIEKFDGAQGEVVNKIKEVTTTNVLEFHSSDRFIKLSFTLLNYTDVSKNLYAWRIDGVYDDWIYQKENSLQFGVLPYGDHTLMIKGQGANGSWSRNELAIIIRVLKPFYLQWWFMGSCLLLFLGGVFTFFWERTRVLRREITKATATIQHQTQELRELDKLKSRFFANVSHELRTPLSLMLGPIKRLLKNNSASKEDRKLLGFLERNTLHLRGLVNEILDLSKLENNKMELQEEATLFYPYLKQHMRQYYSVGDSESIVFSIELPDNKDLKILLDQNRFEKIINNYLSNAIKFTPPKGVVKVVAITEKQTILISVTDTGRGIHPNDLPHVFDRFYQSKIANAATEGGTGIGLSICKELSSLMNGQVWAESKPGYGSTFYLRIPIKRTNEATVKVDAETNTEVVSPLEVALSTNENVAPEGPRKTILAVEDNSDLREFYKIILSDYKVFTAEHGQAALDYLGSHPAPDLIISDLMMPVMDGMQLLENLKSSDAYRHLPVIMLTAKTNQVEKIKALRYGIDDYLNKPFDEDELLIRIDNLLQNRANRELIDTEGIIAIDSFQEQLSEADISWLEEVEHHVLSLLDSDLLTTGSVASHFAISESSLLRNLKKMTGLTPIQYIREMRLNEARNLLQAKRYKTVAEVAYKVGFRDAAAFTRSFRKRFGKVPTSYMQ